jgi:methylated-DNA-[protein]-cysteine S-methyltransferase
MRKPVKYVIFPTKWGYFGFSGSENGLLRTCLPTPEYEEIEARLLESSPLAQFNRPFFQQAQDRIAAYFHGDEADLGLEIPIDLTRLTPFQREVLTACRRVGSAKTTTYGRLAEKIGNPKAARAVGNALAKNPLPLIIPCHRILPANNSLGGFSAPGGTQFKARMLRHEQTFRH